MIAHTLNSHTWKKNADIYKDLTTILFYYSDL